MDYLRAIAPRSSASVLVSTTTGGTTYEVRKKTAGTSPSQEFKPWDMLSQEGVGEPNEEGKYATYKYTFFPGNFGGVVPVDMFVERTVAASGTSYLNISATCGLGAVTTCAINVESSAASPQTETLSAPPSSLKWCVGVFHMGVYFNIAQKNLLVSPKEVLRETDPSIDHPFALPYKSYFVWEVK